MALAGFQAKNHPQQTARRGAAEDVDDRATHPLDFAELDERHGPFTLDVAAAAHNTKCEEYFTREQDGLTRNWGASRLVQPAVLRDRALDPEGLVVVRRHPRHRDAAPGQPHRAAVVAADG